VNTPVKRRNLTLISKVIQNVANGVLFGSKEEYMNPLNSIVHEYIGKCKQFLLATAQCDMDIPNNNSSSTPSTTTEEQFETIRSVLFKYKDRIGELNLSDDSLQVYDRFTRSPSSNKSLLLYILVVISVGLFAVTVSRFL
jgi:hypothetical protein